MARKRQVAGRGKVVRYRGGVLDLDQLIVVPAPGIGIGARRAFKKTVPPCPPQLHAVSSVPHLILCRGCA